MSNIDVNQKMENGYTGNIIPSSDPMVRFNGIAKHPQYECIIFVEGPDDKNFYMGCIHKFSKFRREQVFFIHNGKNGGKKHVISMYHFCLTQLSKINKKQIHFIIDKDYDNPDLVLQNEDEIRRITVLPCYSFENMYFNGNNISNVFKILFGNEAKFRENEFQKAVNSFIKSISWYSACKKVTVFNKLVKNGFNPNYDVQFRKVDFSQPQIIDKEVLLNMNRCIQSWCPYISTQYYSQLQQYIGDLSTSVDNIKGHILFNFLIDYIEYVRNSKNDEYLIKTKLFELSSKLYLNLKMAEGLSISD